MECKANGNKIKISGNIKSIDHFQTILHNIETLKKNYRELEIHILDSISLTSSVIGYFSKLVHADKLSLKVLVSDMQLYDLLEDLGLVETLQVRKI